MTMKTYRPDDPELAKHLASIARGASEPAGTPLPSNFSPKFGDYIAGRLDAPQETVMTQKRAKEDEVVTLPDGRQIQIQAAGAPIVDEKIAERERELAQSAIDAADADHLLEIQPEGKTKAITTASVPETKSRPLASDKSK